MNGNILDSSGNPIKDRKLFETIVNWLCKYWKIWLPIVISMFALITSIASYGLSRKAILLSTDQFFMENKPYIILQPEKFSQQPPLKGVACKDCCPLKGGSNPF